MGKHHLTLPAFLLAGRSVLDAEDIGDLRRHVFPQGIVSERDVKAILALCRLRSGKCRQWRDYVVEAITAFVVDICHPHGVVDESNARWLTNLIARDGVIHSEIELEIVLHVLEKAPQVPDSLATLALDQLRLAICEERGTYHSGRAEPQAGIGLDDLAYVYRILRGSVDRGRVMLPGDHLECLTRIRAESPSAKQHHPGWYELLRAIAPAIDAREDRQPVRWLHVSDSLLLGLPLAA